VPSVRRIRRDDATLLRQVRLAALLDAPSAFSATHAGDAARPAEEWEARAVAGADGNDRVTFFALDDDGAVIGLVGGMRPRPDVAAVELVSMWTAPTARRRGVGRALVQAVLDWADEVGDVVSLGVVDGNDDAQALYARMGFVETGERHELPSDPSRVEIRMRRGAPAR